MRIRVSTYDDGFVFALDPRDLPDLEGTGASPADKIFIAYDTKPDFEFYRCRQELLAQVIYLLTGLGKSGLHKLAKPFEFIRSRDDELLKSFAIEQL